MSRFWEIMTRRPPLIAPAQSDAQPGVPFGFALESDITGWTVTAFGADGRRLGRPLKGLSDTAQATLIRPVNEATTEPDLQELADAWVRACKGSTTNADVLVAFAEAATRIETHSSGV